MLYIIYRSLTSLAAPILTRLTQKRLQQGKEHSTRFTERFGDTATSRPDGKLMWLHGASVGEALSILPLLTTLQSRLPGWHFLLTTGTVTSAALMAQRLPLNVIHQFLPWDHPRWAAKFLDHWQPDAVIWLESELWPNMLHGIKTRGIPACLLNARMRPKSQKKWFLAPGFIRDMLATFTIILTGARDYVPVFKALGGRNVAYLGNLKFTARPLPVAIDELNRLKTRIGGRPCLGFLQTHPTEEIMAAEILQQLRAMYPDLLGIIAPRNVTRGEAIKAELQKSGFSVAQRSKGETIASQTEIYLADTMGEMGLWYSLCPIAVIGGSFIPFGGQNPIEGTHFGTIVLYGPGMFNFPELSAALEQAQAALRVYDRTELLTALTTLLQDAGKREAMRHAAQLLANQNVHVVDAIADEIMLALVPS